MKTYHVTTHENTVWRFTVQANSVQEAQEIVEDYGRDDRPDVREISRKEQVHDVREARP